MKSINALLALLLLIGALGLSSSTVTADEDQGDQDTSDWISASDD